MKNNLDIPMVISHINRVFAFINDANFVDHSGFKTLIDKDSFKGTDLYTDTILIINRISMKAKYDFETTYTTKICIDDMMKNLSDDDIELSNIDDSITYYNKKMIFLNDLYKIDKATMNKYIFDDISKYHNTYNNINKKVLDCLYDNIDIVYRNLGAILFRYGKMGNKFNTLYKYYYSYDNINDIDKVSSIGIIMKYIKFIHKSTNYNTEVMRYICNALRQKNNP